MSDRPMTEKEAKRFVLIFFSVLISIIAVLVVLAFNTAKQDLSPAYESCRSKGGEVMTAVTDVGQKGKLVCVDQKVLIKDWK